MNNQRRNVLKTGSGAALLSVLASAGIIAPGMALADWNKAAFDAKSMADTLKALGATSATDSKDVQVVGPDIAENGATVQVGVTSTLPNVTMMAILIEKNPNALARMSSTTRRETSSAFSRPIPYLQRAASDGSTSIPQTPRSRPGTVSQWPTVQARDLSIWNIYNSTPRPFSIKMPTVFLFRRPCGEKGRGSKQRTESRLWQNTLNSAISRRGTKCAVRCMRRC